MTNRGGTGNPVRRGRSSRHAGKFFVEKHTAPHRSRPGRPDRIRSSLRRTARVRNVVRRGYLPFGAGESEHTAQRNFPAAVPAAADGNRRRVRTDSAAHGRAIRHRTQRIGSEHRPAAVHRHRHGEGTSAATCGLSQPISPMRTSISRRRNRISFISRARPRKAPPDCASSCRAPPPPPSPRKQKSAPERRQTPSRVPGRERWPPPSRDPWRSRGCNW